MTFQVTIVFGLSFLIFLTAILDFVGLFLLLQIDWNFASVSWAVILNWNFRLQNNFIQTSNFRDEN